MKKKSDVNILVDKLMELYNYYETYIWGHNNEKCQINIYFEELKYRLVFLKDNCEPNELILEFDKKEDKLYNYIATKTMVEIFKNVNINKEKNKFNNPVHKPYLNLYVEDGSLLEELRAISVLLNGNSIDDVNSILESKYQKLKRKKKIDEDIIMKTYDRLAISKKLIRSGINE